ncbi:DNLI-like protein [Mya arenaria]|uniref:DNLI-like protein n=1 Tax=Mya arenaria TaxID=6604 RepID=A0ABY7EVD1_MYAAR|nr:DNLI-like protein [Mya arenaria]
MSDKKKCQYFEKCYRKDKNHLAEYLHPRDLKAAAADKTDVKPAMRKEKTVELKDEEVPVKTSLRKRKTHEMSVYDDDTPAEPPAKRVKREKSKTSADKEPAKEDTAKSPTPASEPSPSTSKSPSPGAGKRMRCKYWDKCYRKDKGHKALYVHPGDPDEKQAEKFKEGVAGRTRTAARPKPLHHMDSIDSVLSGGMTLKRTGSVYACTCEEYKGSENFGKAENMKTCSHLVKYLGEDFERVRCELPEKGKKAHIPQHVKISVLLAHKYKDGETNPTNWWMSEKLDGVFDAPHLEKEPFEKRMKAIQDQFEKVKGTDHVDKELARIIALGGEGLMIRKPGSKYERTRSTTLLKIKKFHDAEAIVIGYEPSKSNPGLTGALWVKMACGKKFKVGSGLSNKDRRSPPKKGTIITYKFQELTNSGSPRFPSYVGIRIDMTEPKDAEGVVMLAGTDTLTHTS